MNETIADWVKACDTCARSKRRSAFKSTPLTPISARGLFTQVHLDVMELDGAETRKGNKKILFMIDHFSRWTECVALRAKTASLVAVAFYNAWVMRYGVPRELLVTDSGSEFANSVIKHLCKRSKLKHLKTTPYRKHVNGVVERVIRTARQMMRA